MRLAYFSPLPPQRSGIADYSEELLPYLARYADIELFVADGYQPARSLSRRFRLYSYRSFPSLVSTRGYDATIYHLGNNPNYHAMIYRMALDYPGIVVLHEYVLQDLIRGITLNQGDPEGYVAEMRYCYGQTGVRLARFMRETGQEVDFWAYPLFERVVDASLGLIVHSEYTRQRVLASRPKAHVARVNHHLSLRGLSGDRDGIARSRAALGLPKEAPIIGAFGHVTPQKRIGVALRAFARLRREFPQAMFVVVGEVSPHYDVPLLDDPGEGVVLTGRTEMDDFLHYMVAVDFAVNLRYPQGGETSGSLIRLMGIGKPVVVSNTGSFSEYPDKCCVKVDVDELEGEMVLAVMRALSCDDELRRQIGTNARRYIQTHHTLEQSAKGYCRAILDIKEAPHGPVAAVPPLGKWAEDDMLTELIADIAADIVDIGIGEEEEGLLRSLAGAIVELDVDKERR